MASLVKLAVAAGLALCATPALAFTTAPGSETPSGRQFADPDAALDSMTSTLRDTVVANNLPALGGPSAGRAYFDGSGSDASVDRPSGSFMRFGGARGFGATPTLSGAALYDGEAPFMPIVVGAPLR